MNRFYIYALSFCLFFSSTIVTTLCLGDMLELPGDIPPISAIGGYSSPHLKEEPQEVTLSELGGRTDAVSNTIKRFIDYYHDNDQSYPRYQECIEGDDSGCSPIFMGNALKHQSHQVGWEHDFDNQASYPVYEIYIEDDSGKQHLLKKESRKENAVSHQTVLSRWENNDKMRLSYPVYNTFIVAEKGLQVINSYTKDTATQTYQKIKETPREEHSEASLDKTHNYKIYISELYQRPDGSRYEFEYMAKELLYEIKVERKCETIDKGTDRVLARSESFCATQLIWCHNKDTRCFVNIYGKSVIQCHDQFTAPNGRSWLGKVESGDLIEALLRSEVCTSENNDCRRDCNAY